MVEGRVAAASGRRAADEHKQLAAREEEDAERALNALTVRSPSTTARASRRSSPVLAGC